MKRICFGPEQQVRATGEAASQTRSHLQEEANLARAACLCLGIRPPRVRP